MAATIPNTPLQDTIEQSSSTWRDKLGSSTATRKKKALLQMTLRDGWNRWRRTTYSSPQLAMLMTYYQLSSQYNRICLHLGAGGISTPRAKPWNHISAKEGLINESFYILSYQISSDASWPSLNSDELKHEARIKELNEKDENKCWLAEFFGNWDIHVGMKSRCNPCQWSNRIKFGFTTISILKPSGF